MPLVETSSLKQDATMWARSGVNRAGEPKRLAPVDIRCRLEKVSKNQLSPEGEVITSDAIADVDTTIVEGSIIRLGKVIDLPASPDNLYEVVGYYEIPDIRGRVQGRYVTLNHYQGTLPSLDS